MMIVLGSAAGSTFHYGAHVAVALALISLGVGYLVCHLACKSECCQKFGKFVGGLIMVVSFMLLICLSIFCVKGVSKWTCPMTEQNVTTTAPAVNGK